MRTSPYYCRTHHCGVLVCSGCEWGTYTLVERLRRIDKHVRTYGLYNRKASTGITWATFGVDEYDEYDEEEEKEEDRVLYYLDPPYWRRHRMVRGRDGKFRFEPVEGYVDLHWSLLLM